MAVFLTNVSTVCLLLLQHCRVIEELKHEREGFQEVLQAKDKELEVTKVLIPVGKIHVSHISFRHVLRPKRFTAHPTDL